MLALVNQKGLGFQEIGRDTKPWRVGQREAAVDKGREGFGKYSLERVLHGVMFKQSIAADGGQRMCGRMQADT